MEQGGALRHLATQGSIPSRRGICTAYDSERDPGAKVVLSRTAQRNLFALWVFAPYGDPSHLRMIASRGRNWLSPCREDECIDG
jgi:hypothetical protein